MKAPAEPLDMSTFVDGVAKLSQVSGLSSVQLSPNKVCEDYANDTLDVFPIFQVSPEPEGYFPDTSPVTSPTPTELTGHTGSRFTTGSLDSFVGSPVTCGGLVSVAAPFDSASG